jgi:hypothetical protein
LQSPFARTGFFVSRRADFQFASALENTATNIGQRDQAPPKRTEVRAPEKWNFLDNIFEHHSLIL